MLIGLGAGAVPVMFIVPVIEPSCPLGLNGVSATSAESSLPESAASSSSSALLPHASENASRQSATKSATKNRARFECILGILLKRLHAYDNSKNQDEKPSRSAC